MPVCPQASESPPKWLPSRLCGQYEAPSYGSWALVDLLAAGKPNFSNEGVKNFVARYLSSKSIGKAWERIPAMLAICGPNMVWDAYELYYIREGCYFGVPIYLVADAEEEGAIRKAPVWVSWPARDTYDTSSQLADRIDSVLLYLHNSCRQLSGRSFALVSSSRKIRQIWKISSWNTTLSGRMMAVRMASALGQPHLPRAVEFSQSLRNVVLCRSDSLI